MGCCLSTDKVEPIPREVIKCAIALKRRSTDTAFLLAFVAFLLGLLGLVCYCIYYGDIYRIVYGYDNCGNVCGRNNSFDAMSDCTAIDKTGEKFLIIELKDPLTQDLNNLNRKCAVECPENSLVLLNRCLPSNSGQKSNNIFSKNGIGEFFHEVHEDISACSYEILYMFGTAFLGSIVILLLFKYSADIVVWFVLIAIECICILVTIAAWHMYVVELNINRQSDIRNEQMTVALVIAIIASIATIVVTMVIFFMRHRIRLVIRLFKEAGKVITKMPLLLFEPILTFICVGLIIAVWLYLCVWIESAGVLTNQNATSAAYVKDGAIKTTRWYNLLALLWCMQFVIACQHIVIAGAVATWFFTRDKDDLGTPILSSFDRLIRYHLGTAACGSMLVAVAQFIRTILSLFRRDPNSATPGRATMLPCCESIFYFFENCLKYISRQAYIETAIRGSPFFAASKIAFTRLTANKLRVIAINSIGDFVLFLGKIAVVGLTIFVGVHLLKTKENVHHMWMLLVFGAIFAYVIAHTFISVFEMTIDTIFLCFCEDYEENDGMSRPYFMSAGLMEFVESSKSALELNNQSIA